MVTAIEFEDATPQAIFNYSAITFVEINSNQTKVSSSHLDAIAYDILGETTPRAIAAKVILEVNKKKLSKKKLSKKNSGALYGLFDTNQIGQGLIKATTVRKALQSITNLNTIQRLSSPRSDVRKRLRGGYENLFDAEIEELGTAEVLIGKTVSCLIRYFENVRETFSHDWPERGRRKGTSLEYAKMIAGFIRLLKRFLEEGISWDNVNSELEKIRDNVMQLRGMQEYNAILFLPTDPNIPDADPKDVEDFRFLNSNRERATSIQEIVEQRHQR